MTRRTHYLPYARMEVAAPTREEARSEAERLRPGCAILRVRGLGHRWWAVYYRPHTRGCPCGIPHHRSPS